MTPTVRDVVANALGIAASELPPDAAMSRFYKWDSLAQLRVILALESAFDITVTNDDVLRFTSLEQIRNALGALE